MHWHLRKRFAKKLDDLWRRRTAELRALVIPQGPGASPQFSKTVRQKHTDELLSMATDLLLGREGKKEFRRTYSERRLRQIGGGSLEKRALRLSDWAKSQAFGPIVYAFWKGKKCLYVGKGDSWKRLAGYAKGKSAYLLQATCVEVFCVKGKSHLPKAECLATHLFEPQDQKVKPANKKWGKKCPICRKRDHIRDDLQALFKMK